MVTHLMLMFILGYKRLGLLMLGEQLCQKLARLGTLVPSRYETLAFSSARVQRPHFYSHCRSPQHSRQNHLHLSEIWSVYPNLCVSVLCPFHLFPPPRYDPCESPPPLCNRIHSQWNRMLTLQASLAAIKVLLHLCAKKRNWTIKKFKIRSFNILGHWFPQSHKCCMMDD